MQIEVEPQGNCYARVVVLLTRDEVDDRYRRATRKVGRGAHLPGFRPGKLPAPLLERHFGPQIDQEAVELVLGETLWSAIEERALHVVARPSIESISIKRGATGRYVAQVELFPTLGAVTYEGLEAVHLEAEITPDQLEARLAAEQKKHVTLVPAADRTTIALGDRVLADYVGMDGDSEVAATKQADQMLEIQADRFIPGFVEGLVGQSVPGPARVPITFPTDYGYAPLAGRSLDFVFDLKELKVEQLPAIDDELAKDSGYDDLAAMRAALSAELLESAKADVAGRNEDALLAALSAANPFELSTGIVDRQTEAMIVDREARLKRLIGDHYSLGVDEVADLRTSLRVEAERVVRAGILVAEVAKAAHIEITEAMVAEAMSKDASGEDASDGSAAERLRHRLLHEQVVARLAATAKHLPAPPAAPSPAA